MSARLRSEAHLNVESALSLQHLSDGPPSHRLHDVEHLRGVDAVARNLVPPDLYAQKRQPRRLLQLDVCRALHRGDNANDVGSDATEFVQVLPEQGDGLAQILPLRLRREHGLGTGGFAWVAGPADASAASGGAYPPEVLAFSVRDVVVVANLGTTPVPAPAGARVLLASTDVTDGSQVPAESTVWFTR